MLGMTSRLDSDAPLPDPDPPLPVTLAPAVAVPDGWLKPWIQPKNPAAAAQNATTTTRVNTPSDFIFPIFTTGAAAGARS
jgi:hypothetical protein